MRAIVLNCTLKPSPELSNTEVLAEAVVDELARQKVDTEVIRIVDRHVPPGVATSMGGIDDWPAIHDAICKADILIIASPTWMGHPSSIAQRVLERMDAMISETAESGLPVAYGKVAGVVCTGNEDGAHHVISEICGGLIDIGFTIPGQAWTYWNKGPGPGQSYSETDYRHDWSTTTGRTAASVLVAVARALAVTPIPADAYRASSAS